MTNESILISEVIPATPQRIFSAWMDSAEHSAFTGDEAMVVNEVGGEHRAAGGYIQGRTLELNEGSRIVQSWRTTEFPPESPDSRVEITLEPTLGGTLVTLLHTDIPVGQGDRYRQSWNEYYLSRLKSYFSDGELDTEETVGTKAGGGRNISVDVDVELDEETAVGDLEPTAIAEAPTKVMRPKVKRALTAASRGGGVKSPSTGDTETVRVAQAAAPQVQTARKSKARSKSVTGKASRTAARKPARAAAKSRARRPAKPATKPATKKAAARRAPKKAAAKAARKPVKKAPKKVAARRGKATRGPATRSQAKRSPAKRSPGKRSPGKRKAGSRR